MLAELEAFKLVLELPKRPVAAIVGGAKVSTKIPLLTNLAPKVDMLIIGGGMANTFLHAQGYPVGKSLCEPDFADTVEEIMSRAAETGCRIVLPTDAVVAKRFEPNAPQSVYSVNDIPADGMILDIGPQIASPISATRIRSAKTLLWNGPVGAFETPPFGAGTFELAKLAAARTRERRACLGGRRRRYGRGAEHGWRHGELHLCIDGRGRVSGMARRTRTARRRRAGASPGPHARIRRS